MKYAYMAVTSEGWSILKYARKFGIPGATLQDRVSGRADLDIVKSGMNLFFLH